MIAAQILTQHRACDKSIVWSKKRSPKAAWDACERGDWLLWIAARLGVKREIVVFSACQCARLALKHTKDPRALTCIETTEAWTRGEATVEDVRRDRAAAAADASAYAAYAADGAAAELHAAYAAAAADASASAAYVANAAASAYASASAYAYAAADASAYAAARKKTQKACAALVRKHIPWKLIAERLKETK